MYCGKVTKSLRSQKKEHQDIETGRGTAFDKLMNITDLAAYLDLPEATLYQWRYRREGPPSIKVGVSYPLPEVGRRRLAGLKDGGRFSVTA